MSDSSWANDFNHAYLSRFKFIGGSHLDLSDQLALSDEFLWHAQEQLREELAAEDEGYFKNPGRRDRGRYRTSVEECSRAIQCATDRFIDALKIFYPNEKHPHLSIGQQITQALEWGEKYEAHRGWPRAFPPKVSALINTNVLRSQSALFWANGLRKAVIHEYENPSLKDCLTLLSIATMYCSILKSKLQWVWEELELVSEFGEQLELSFRPKLGRIYYDYSLDHEKLAACRERLREAEASTGSVLSPDNLETRRMVDTIQSNIPAPARWQGEVNFTDVEPYRNWLGLLLEWSGRTHGV